MSNKTEFCTDAFSYPIMCPHESCDCLMRNPSAQYSSTSVGRKGKLSLPKTAVPVNVCDFKTSVYLLMHQTLEQKLKD